MSIARTRNVWSPTSTVTSTGEVHAANGSASSEHSKVEPASFEVKLKLVSTSVVSASGPEMKVVTGGVLSASTVQLHVAGVGSTFPDASMAWTSRVCGPSSRPVKSDGTGHGVNPARSSEHSKVELASSLSKANVDVVLTCGLDGPNTIVVSGGSISVTVHW